MRWKTKYKPRAGDTRWVHYFAWFPVECRDGYTYWLTKISEYQIYWLPNRGGHSHWEARITIPRKDFFDARLENAEWAR